MNRDEICITGISSVNRYGVGIDSFLEKVDQAPTGSNLEDYSLSKFRAVKHISDRRMMKAISKVDAIGLATFEEAIKDAKWKSGHFDAERMGVYVGAAPATSFDNEEYMDSQKQADSDIKAFGGTCMSSRPTTLLLGLPNNVLCYGSLVIDARGPNDNYTSGDLSGHIAIMNAAKQVQRKRLDFAVAGGFSANTESVNSWLFHRLGHTQWPEDGQDFVTKPYGEGREGAIPADGSVFMTLESRGHAEARGATPRMVYCSGAQRSDAVGPDAIDPESEGLELAMKAAMKQANITANQVGVVFTSATGFAPSDNIEAKTIKKIFDDSRPAVAFLSRHLGHLYEAGGMMEIGVASQLDHEIPETLKPCADGPLADYRQNWDHAKPYILVLRSSAWGEYSCLALRREFDA